MGKGHRDNHAARLKRGPEAFEPPHEASAGDCHAIYRAWLAERLSNREAVEMLAAAGHVDAAKIVDKWIDEWAAVETEHYLAATR